MIADKIVANYSEIFIMVHLGDPANTVVCKDTYIVYVSNTVKGNPFFFIFGWNYKEIEDVEHTLICFKGI